MPSKHAFLLVLVLFVLAPALAKIGVGVEPVIGYQRSQKLVPTPHTKDGLTYGARLTAGVPLISLEAEYLRGNDSEWFPDLDLTVKDESDKAKLGLRSTFPLVGFLSAFVRGGGQASRYKHTEVTGGVSAESTTPIKYYPYLGAGLRARLGRSVSLIGDVTTVFHNFPSMNDNEYQATAGFVVQFP